MKKIISIIALLFIVIFGARHYMGTMTNEPDGFHGVRWHAVVSEDAAGAGGEWEAVDNQIGASDSCRVYEKKNDRLSIGEAKLDSIFYLFREGLGFVSATAYFEGSGNFELVRAWCVEEWGEPADENVKRSGSGELDSAELSWKGKKADTMIWYAGGADLGALHIYLKESCSSAVRDCVRLLLH